MRVGISLLTILSCYETNGTTASYCHLDRCKNTTLTAPTVGSRCTIARVEETKDCDKLHFESAYHLPTSNNMTKFHLSAYVGDSKERSERSIAFNLLIMDISFLRLIVRYQDLANKEKSPFCRQLDFIGDEINPSSKDILLSCLFNGDLLEGSPYRMEYLVIEKHQKYSKILVFTVPYRKLLDENNNVTTYVPFVYVDVSNPLVLSLYVQPLPPKFNVTKYRIWLSNNDTLAREEVTLSLSNDEQHVRYNFSVEEGAYYFQVAALHADCGKYGCINATSPLITIKEASHRLLIMIISIIWIPPVILYAFYHIFKLYKKKEASRKKKRNKNCLLVYSPTREVHIRVMAELAKYLKSCNINAVIDMCDTSESVTKDIEDGWDTAFYNANVVLVATSPSPSEEMIKDIHEERNNRALRLIKENCRTPQNKTYYVIEFPYCKPSDVPEGTQHFKRFRMPEELSKLVKVIRNDNCLRLIDLSDKEFLDNIKLAQTEITKDGNSGMKDTDETDGLLPSAIANDLTPDTMERSRAPLYTRKNVNETRLLVKSLEGKKEFANVLYDSTSGRKQCVGEEEDV